MRWKLVKISHSRTKARTAQAISDLLGGVSRGPAAAASAEAGATTGQEILEAGERCRWTARRDCRRANPTGWTGPGVSGRSPLLGGGVEPVPEPQGPLLSAKRPRTRAAHPGVMFMRLDIDAGRTFNSGRETMTLVPGRGRREGASAMTLDPALFGADAARIRSARLSDGVATLVVDATGLGDEERSALEARLKAVARPRSPAWRRSGSR